MSACSASALSARTTGLFICGLILLLVFSQLAPQVEAKKTVLYQDASADTYARHVVQRHVLNTDTEINCTKTVTEHATTVTCEGETFHEEELKDAPGSAAFMRDLILSIFFVLTAGTYKLFSAIVRPIAPSTRVSRAV